MCCRTQKYTCVEAGALTYGIITCILSILASIACAGLFIYKFLHLINYQDTLLYFHIGVAAAAFFLCGITFGFSVALAIGITQRIPSQVKLAFIFGVVEVTILVVGLAIYIGFYPEDAVVNGVIMAILVVYSLPLAVVWRAYKEYAESSSKYESCTRTSDP